MSTLRRPATTGVSCRPNLAPHSTDIITQSQQQTPSLSSFLSQDTTPGLPLTIPRNNTTHPNYNAMNNSTDINNSTRLGGKIGAFGSTITSLFENSNSYSKTQRHSTYNNNNELTSSLNNPSFAYTNIMPTSASTNMSQSLNSNATTLDIHPSDSESNQDKLGSLTAQVFDSLPHYYQTNRGVARIQSQSHHQPLQQMPVSSSKQTGNNTTTRKKPTSAYSEHSAYNESSNQPIPARLLRKVASASIKRGFHDVVSSTNSNVADVINNIAANTTYNNTQNQSANHKSSGIRRDSTDTTPNNLKNTPNNSNSNSNNRPSSNTLLQRPTSGSVSTSTSSTSSSPSMQPSSSIASSSSSMSANKSSLLSRVLSPAVTHYELHQDIQKMASEASAMETELASLRSLLGATFSVQGDPLKDHSLRVLSQQHAAMKSMAEALAARVSELNAIQTNLLNKISVSSSHLALYRANEEEWRQVHQDLLAQKAFSDARVKELELVNSKLQEEVLDVGERYAGVRTRLEQRDSEAKNNENNMNRRVALMKSELDALRREHHQLSTSHTEQNHTLSLLRASLSHSQDTQHKLLKAEVDLDTILRTDKRQTDILRDLERQNAQLLAENALFCEKLVTAERESGRVKDREALELNEKQQFKEQCEVYKASLARLEHLLSTEANSNISKQKEQQQQLILLQQQLTSCQQQIEAGVDDKKRLEDLLSQQQQTYNQHIKTLTEESNTQVARINELLSSLKQASAQNTTLQQEVTVLKNTVAECNDSIADLNQRLSVCEVSYDDVMKREEESRKRMAEFEILKHQAEQEQQRLRAVVEAKSRDIKAAKAQINSSDNAAETLRRSLSQIQAQSLLDSRELAALRPLKNLLQQALKKTDNAETALTQERTRIEGLVLRLKEAEDMRLSLKAEALQYKVKYQAQLTIRDELQARLQAVTGPHNSQYQLHRTGSSNLLPITSDHEDELDQHTPLPLSNPMPTLSENGLGTPKPTSPKPLSPNTSMRTLRTQRSNGPMTPISTPMMLNEPTPLNFMSSVSTSSLTANPNILIPPSPMSSMTSSQSHSTLSPRKTSSFQ